MAAKPVHPHLSTRKLLYHDLGSGFDQVCTATLHQRLPTTFLHPDSKVVPLQFVPRPLTHKIKLVPGWQKHVPYLSCHRDSKVAKVPGHVAGWRRQVTQPPFIAGPLATSVRQIIETIDIQAIFFWPTCFY